MILAGALASGCFQPEAPRLPAAPVAQSATAVERSAEAGTPASDDATGDLPELALLTRDGKSPAVRSEALLALADFGDQADPGAIGGALTDPDPSVRRTAIVALTGLDGEVPASLLAIALNDPDARVRRDAVEALGEVGGATARAALAQALNDADPEVRDAAAEMLEEPEPRR